MRGFHRETRSPQRSCCWKLKSYSPTCPDCGRITGYSSLIGLGKSSRLSRLAAVLFCATPRRRQTYSRSIEFA
jgi:hypothetical protein